MKTTFQGSQGICLISQETFYITNVSFEKDDRTNETAFGLLLVTGLFSFFFELYDKRDLFTLSDPCWLSGWNNGEIDVVLWSALTILLRIDFITDLKFFLALNLQQ